MNQLNAFIEELATTRVTPNTFNQYAYGDIGNAVRRENLLLYLEQMRRLNPRILLVGEAPGYKGCRLTGVPFTSETILMNRKEGIELFGKENGYRLPSEKNKFSNEATATMIRGTMTKFGITALAWNAFPFHPHKADNKDSNRTPSRKELQMGEKSLFQMIEMFNIQKVVAVGNKAGESLLRLGISYQKVRHPANGGKNKFVEGIRMVQTEFIV